MSPGLWAELLGCLSCSLPLSPAAPLATMRNIFKRNQEPIVAPATTTATMPVRPADNSTESTATGESQEDMFAKLKDKFFNEINKIPCEWPYRARAGPEWLRCHREGLGWALRGFQGTL